MTPADAHTELRIRLAHLVEEAVLGDATQETVERRRALFVAVNNLTTDEFQKAFPEFYDASITREFYAQLSPEEQEG